MTKEQLEKKITKIVNGGETKNYKFWALAELSNFDDTVCAFPSTREIVNMYPDFNSVSIRIKMGQVFEQHIYLDIDYLKEHLEEIPLIAEHIANLYKLYEEVEDDNHNQ